MADKKLSSRPAIVEEALTNFKRASEAESSWRADCLEDLRFSTLDQWPMNIKTLREREGTPCLTMDLTLQAIRLTCNAYRQQRPSVRVNPVGNGADVDTADILQGIIRHIEVNSDAEIAYDGAHESVVRCGIGHWRLFSDYADEESGDQEVLLKPIRNAFSVYWQPGIPYEDATWCLVIEDLPKEQYEFEYPDSDLTSLQEYVGIGNAPPEWLSKDTVRVAEYFKVDLEQRKGRAPKRKVSWHKINAIEELDSRELPGSSIPILTAVGDDLDVDGKRYLAGLIRNAKDPQRMYNYQNSKATETIALGSKAPWIMAEGQDEGHEQEWGEANTRSLSRLIYKQVDINGKPAPPPERNAAEPPIQAINMMIQQSSLNVKASMGIYDPSLGQRKGDESGKAIENLQEQGNISTLNFSDNVARTMRRNGKLLLEWIRKIYDTPRIMRIINPDGSVKQVVTHMGPDQVGDAQKLAEENKAIQKIYDIGTGKYDVTISVGPSYQTKRQEAVATQLDLIKTLPPNAAMAVIDIVTRNMDIPQSDEIADRLKKLLPPQLIDQNDTDPQSQVQLLQAKLEQLSQQHALLAKVATEQGEVIKTKQVEQQGKVQIASIQEMTKSEIVKMQEATKLAVAQINASKDANQAFAENEIKQFDIMHQSAHDLAMQQQQNVHEQDMAQQQAQQATESQQSDQHHQQEMATVGQES